MNKIFTLLAFCVFSYTVQAQQTQGCEPPVANFSYQIVNCQVCFIDSSLYAETYMIDWGDSSTDGDSCHSYPFNGTFCIGLLVTNACGTDDTIICVTVDCVGIEEETVDNLSLFPNPANENFTLHFSSPAEHSYRLSLIDVLGKNVYSENTGNVTGEYYNTLDVSGFASGMYMLQIMRDDGKMQSIKFIKE